MKRSRIKPRRSTPRRRDAPQADAEWWAEATMLLLGRSGSRCERCGKPLAGAMERHHRQRRRDGGDRLSNLLALHPSCHQWITEHPAEAREHGWIVSASNPDPSRMPVMIAGGWWLLDDLGGKIRV